MSILTKIPLVKMSIFDYSLIIMKRTAYHDLLAWKNHSARRPLLLMGARQVGKTWLMQEFGKAEYNNVVYVNFENTPLIRAQFDYDLKPDRLITMLSAEYNVPILPTETLIIFDEIQECNRALNSLKYFEETAPQYHIIAAGSFLGVAMHPGFTFPVGKVDRLTLYPLSFYEFLDAIGEGRMLAAAKSLDKSLIQGLAPKFIELMRLFFYIGGMPRSVLAYIQQNDLNEARRIQNEILADYRSDFTKHITPPNIPKVGMIWDSIPVHLSREKKRVVYKEIKKGGRASAFEDAMQWLVDTGLVYKTSRVTLPEMPLAVHAEKDHFKLYMLDIGLLGAKAEIELKYFLNPDSSVVSNYNGALTEQFIMQELKSAGFSPYYWGRDKGAAELDFILQCHGEVIPLEVKAGIRKRSKSLDVYRELYLPALSVRATLKNLGVASGLYSIPLYLIASLRDIVTES